MPVIRDIIGPVGLLILLIGQFLLYKKRVNQEDWRYFIINIIGAALLEVYSFMLRDMIFIVLQAFWIATSLFGLLKYVFRRYKLKAKK